MDFLKDFEKVSNKLVTVTDESHPPEYWFSSGNYVLNNIMSGSFRNCVGQSRLLGLCGNSGAGKSFLAVNLIREAQKKGAYNVVIDSENALDDEFVTKIGVDVTKNYTYRSVVLISDAVALVSSLIKGYKTKHGDDPNAPPLHITIDSLDMLLTDSEFDNFNKGESKGDQGQKNKQLKAMLRTFVASIKSLNISIVVTGQVYANQDIKNGEGKWIISDAIKYSLSNIILIDKLKLKDAEKEVTGIRMRCEGYKTRFTKPYQKVTIEVPYEEGMNPASGLLEIAVDIGVIKQNSAWYTLVSTGEKFQRKNFNEKLIEATLNDLESIDNLYLNRETLGDDEEIPIDRSEPTVKNRLEERHLVELDD